MKSMMKDAAILFVITLISGAVLGLVYQVTKTPIAQQQIKAKNEACQEVFADAASFEALSQESGVSPETMSAFVQAQGFDVSVDDAMAATDESGTLLGYVITVTDHEGYGGDIQFSVGIRMDQTVNGISILNISETAGLGMQAEKVLKPQFANKLVERFEYTKTGAAAENQIDAISGATITTSAVTSGVNAALACFQNFFITEGGQANE